MLRTLSQTAQRDPVTAEVCSKSTADWARQTLNFQPNPKQAEVLDTQAKYLVLCCNRQWGKSTTIAVKSLHRALSKPNQSIVILSRTKHQAAILIRIAQLFLPRLKIRLRRVLGFQFSLEFPNGSSIIAVAHNGDTSVGNTANVLVVDEAALVQDNVYWNVAAAVSRTHGNIWLMSTPRRQAGFFYNIWHNGDKRWHRIFSPVTDCPEIDPDYLEMQKLADPIKYRQDFMCEFIQAADRLTNRETIERMFKIDHGQWWLPEDILDHIPAPK
jgi:hypothetical protein